MTELNFGEAFGKMIQKYEVHLASDAFHPTLLNRGAEVGRFIDSYVEAFPEDELRVHRIITKYMELFAAYTNSFLCREEPLWVDPIRRIFYCSTTNQALYVLSQFMAKQDDAYVEGSSTEVIIHAGKITISLPIKHMGVDQRMEMISNVVESMQKQQSVFAIAARFEEEHKIRPTVEFDIDGEQNNTKSDPVAQYLKDHPDDKYGHPLTADEKAEIIKLVTREGLDTTCAKTAHALYSRLAKPMADRRGGKFPSDWQRLVLDGELFGSVLVMEKPKDAAAKSSKRTERTKKKDSIPKYVDGKLNDEWAAERAKRMGLAALVAPSSSDDDDHDNDDESGKVAAHAAKGKAGKEVTDEKLLDLEKANRVLATVDEWTGGCISKFVESVSKACDSAAGKIEATHIAAFHFKRHGFLLKGECKIQTGDSRGSTSRWTNSICSIPDSNDGNIFSKMSPGAVVCKQVHEDFVFPVVAISLLQERHPLLFDGVLNMPIDDPTFKQCVQEFFTDHSPTLSLADCSKESWLSLMEDRLCAFGCKTLSAMAFHALGPALGLGEWKGSRFGGNIELKSVVPYNDSRPDAVNEWTKGSSDMFLRASCSGLANCNTGSFHFAVLFPIVGVRVDFPLRFFDNNSPLKDNLDPNWWITFLELEKNRFRDEKWMREKGVRVVFEPRFIEFEQRSCFEACITAAAIFDDLEVSAMQLHRQKRHEQELKEAKRKLESEDAACKLMEAEMEEKEKKRIESSPEFIAMKAAQAAEKNVKRKQKAVERETRLQHEREERKAVEAATQASKAQEAADAAILKAVTLASQSWERGDRKDALARIPAAMRVHSQNASEHVKQAAKAKRAEFQNADKPAKPDKPKEPDEREIVVSTQDSTAAASSSFSEPPPPPPTTPVKKESNSQRKARRKREKEAEAMREAEAAAARAKEEAAQAAESERRAREATECKQVERIAREINAEIGRGHGSRGGRGGRGGHGGRGEKGGGRAHASAAASSSASAQPGEDPENDSSCVICMDLEATHAGVPCGHMCLCVNCVAKMEKSGNKTCPTCRKQSVMFMRVFT